MGNIELVKIALGEGGWVLIDKDGNWLIGKFDGRILGIKFTFTEGTLLNMLIGLFARKVGIKVVGAEDGLSKGDTDEELVWRVEEVFWEYVQLLVG